MRGNGPDAQGQPIEEILHRVRLYLNEAVDFRRTDTAPSLTKVRLLTVAATYINVLAVDEFGGRAGSIRSPGLVEHAIGAAFQTYEGIDPHPEPFDKAAMLLRGIAQGHPFSDGNKRTGFLTAAYYLEEMGYPFPPQMAVADTVALCLHISAGAIRDVEAIAAELERLWLQPPPTGGRG
jgi:death-on-curing protein